MERERKKKQRIHHSEGACSSFTVPDDIWEMICLTAYKHLTDFNDHVHLRAICSNWRSLVLGMHDTNPSQVVQSSQRIPHLIIPLDPPSFFSLKNDSVNRLELPEACGKFCRGSSEGYLVLLEHTTPSISLLNPLTRNQFHLPPITACPDVLEFDLSRTGKEYYYRLAPDHEMYNSIETMHRIFILKLVLRPNSTPNNYIAMGIFRYPFNRLAFCKSGHKKWISVEGSEETDDIIHYKGQFYALTARGLFVISNLDSPTPSLQRRDYAIESEILRNPTKYLVEISGELMIVVRQTTFLNPDGKYETKRFQVYQLDENSLRLVSKTSIGDHALFVDTNSALASDSPQCIANCIYFTPDIVRCSDKRICHDFGIFDMKQNLVKPFPSSCPVQSFPLRSPSIWITPSMC